MSITPEDIQRIAQLARLHFEKSETMDEFLKGIPLYLIKEDNLGFLGALEVSRNAKNES